MTLEQENKKDKTHVFKVVPNGPNNMTQHIPLCYFHKKRGVWVWLNEFHKEESGSTLPKTANVAMLRIDENNNGYEVCYTESDADANDKIKLITFFKEWPECGKAMPDGSVQSYPSENHQKTYPDFYKQSPNEALPPSKQPLKYIDVEEQIRLSASEKRDKIKISTALNSLLGDNSKLQKVCYLLGENPYGADPDEMFNIVYDAVHEGEKGSRFLAIMESDEWNDRLKLAVETAKVLGIITQTDSGMYQFLGNPISKNEREVPAHFRFHKHSLVELKEELRAKGQEFGDLEINDDGEVVSAATKPKGQGKAAPKPVDIGETP